MKKVFISLMLLQSCVEIGDMFEHITKISDKYSIIENSWGGHSICYKTSEGYEVRGPGFCKALAYAIKDSLLVMKYKLQDSSINFYVLNMTNDRHNAKKEDIYLDTLTVTEFKKSPLSHLTLKLVEQ